MSTINFDFELELELELELGHTLYSLLWQSTTLPVHWLRKSTSRRYPRALLARERRRTREAVSLLLVFLDP